MLTRLLIWLCGVSPSARRALWRWWYGRLARRGAANRWTFMNYGLAWPPGEPPPAFQDADEADRLCAQLYHRVALPGGLAGKEVLEVGCGRGGGASLIARIHAPARLTAVDYSPEAVALCRARHQAPNLVFEKGDAEHLPFPDASFDAVLNVESSHCYGSVESFLAEAARVLRPGGFLLIADLREASDMDRFAAQIANQPRMESIEREDITPLVVAALQTDHERKRALIEELIPSRQRPMFAEFAGLSGSRVHRGLKDRTLLYHRFALRRRS